MKTYTCPICDHTFEAEDAKTCPVCGSLLETVSDEELEKKIIEAKKDTEVKHITTKSPTSTSSSSRSTTSSRSTSSSSRSSTSSSYRSPTSSRTTTPPSSTISPSLLKRHPVTPPPTPTYTRSTVTPTPTRRTTTSTRTTSTRKTSTRKTSTRTTTYSTKSYRGYHIYNFIVGLYSLAVIGFYLYVASMYIYASIPALIDISRGIDANTELFGFGVVAFIPDLVFFIIAFVNFIFLIINIAQNTPFSSDYLLTSGRRNAVRNNHMAFLIIGGILFGLPTLIDSMSTGDYSGFMVVYRIPIILLVIYIVLTIVKNIVYKRYTK